MVRKSKVHQIIPKFSIKSKSVLYDDCSHDQWLKRLRLYHITASNAFHIFLGQLLMWPAWAEQSCWWWVHEWWLLFQHTQQQRLLRRQQSRGKCYHTLLQLSAVWVYHCYWHSNCRTHTLLFKKVSLFSFIFTCNQHSAAASRSTIKVHICSSLIKLKSNWIMKNYDVTYFDYVFHFIVIISVVFNNIALVLLMNFTAGYHHTHQQSSRSLSVNIR